MMTIPVAKDRAREIKRIVNYPRQRLERQTRKYERRDGRKDIPDHMK